MTWEIEIFGDKYVLRELSHSLRKQECVLQERDEHFFLGGSCFSEFQDDRKVREFGKKIVRSLSGTVRFLLESEKEITTGDVFKINEDGRRNIFMTVEPAVSKIKALPISVVKSKDGKFIEEHRPADPAPSFVQKALKHEVVERALRLRDKDHLDWVGLYRLFEVIESDVPIHEMAAKGWASKNKISLLKRTSCSMEAVGDQARHGKSIGDPPRNPMKLSEARGLVDDLLKKWLSWKRE